MDTDTFDVSDDVLEARHAAARAMLAALETALATPAFNDWTLVRSAIAAAKAAGIGGDK
jgi:hypothetical protein